VAGLAFQSSDSTAQTGAESAVPFADLLSAIPADAAIVWAGTADGSSVLANVLYPFWRSFPEHAAGPLTTLFGVTVSQPAAWAAMAGFDDDLYAVVIMGTVALPAGLTPSYTYRGIEVYEATEASEFSGGLDLIANPSGVAFGSRLIITGIIETLTEHTPSIAAHHALGAALNRLDDETSFVSVVAAPGFNSRSESANDDRKVLVSIGSSLNVETFFSGSPSDDDIAWADRVLNRLDSVLGDVGDGPERATGDLVDWLARLTDPTFGRNVEATMNVRRLFDSSVSYYDSDHATPEGYIVPAQFPASIPRTPSEIPCGTAAQPDYELWSAPTWEALNFAVSDEHYYSYQYDSAGTRVGSTFTASAFGDLDCDGVYSTFVRIGEVVPGNEIRGGAGLYQQNPNE